MRINRRNIIRLCLTAVVTGCLLFVFFNLQWFSYLPWQSVELSSIVHANKDSDGNLIIIDDSGHRIMKSNADGVVEFLHTDKYEFSNRLTALKKVITDKDNNIYAVKIQNSDTGTWIEKESVIKLSSQGKQLETLYEVEHESSALRAYICDFHVIDGEVYFIQKSSDSMELKKIDGTTVKELFYDDTDLMLQGFAIEPESEDIYFVTTRGEIGRFSDDGGYETLYAGSADERLPWDICFDKNGVMYVSDIRNRTICLYENGILTSTAYDNEVADHQFRPDKAEICNAPLTNPIEAANGFIGCQNEAVITMDTEVHEYSLLSFSGKLVALITGAWLCAAFLLAFVVYLIIRFGGKIYNSMSAVVKYSVLVISGTLVITVIFSMITIKNIESRLTSEMLTRALTIAEITAANLPKEEFLRLNGPENFLNDDYIKVKNSVLPSFINQDGSPDDLYCVLYTFENHIAITKFSQEENFGAYFPNDWPVSEEEEIMRSKQPLSIVSDTNEGRFIFTLAPIFDEETNDVIALIEVGKDLRSFEKDNRSLMFDLFLNIIVLAIVIILLSLEIIIFIQAKSSYRRTGESDSTAKIPVGMLRIVVFLVFFITNISTSFLPIYAMQLSADSNILWLPKEVIAAIPISAEVLFGSIFSLYGAKFIEMMGRRKAAILGSVLFTAGLVLRAVVPGIWMLSLGSALLGCGWGTALLIVNILIAEEEDPVTRDEGFSSYAAATLNGVNSGVVFGGFLVTWLTYQMVLLSGAVMSLLMVAYSFAFFINKPKAHESKGAKDKSIFKFLLSPNILIYFVTIIIPFVAGGYFIHYLYPIVGSEFGLSETHIGYSYLLNGLCVILFGKMLTKKLSARLSRKTVLAVASFMYILAFMLVAFNQTIPMLLLTLIIFGLSNSFGFPVQSSYFTELEEVREYGLESSMGINSLMENLAETVGPFIFSYVLIIGLQQGLIVLSVIMATLTVMFLVSGLFTRMRKRIKTKE